MGQVCGSAVKPLADDRRTWGAIAGSFLVEPVFQTRAFEPKGKG
jgi:hypothetical protein